MSRRDKKKYVSYLEVPFKKENEPEEGEIIDDYDLIVSSDEELCMRQRIRELEAENEEIEQIAVISSSYVDKIKSSRAAQVPTDVSSISSTEFVTPKKRKRRKSREHKRKHHRQHQYEHSHQYEPPVRYDMQQLPLKTRSKRSHCKRRQKMFAKKHKKSQSDRFIHKEVDAEYLSIESLESSDSSSITDTDNFSYNWLTSNRKEPYSNGKSITRDTLRLAVARNNNDSRINSKKYCLKDKLLGQELIGQHSNISTNERYGFVGEHDMGEDDDVQVIENEPDIQTVDEDSTDSMEEKELRLIALKSAVLKKHMARKIRNAEAAYSPTDFDEMLSSGILRHGNKLDDIDVVDLEGEDSQTACATVSPDASPQLMILEDQEESQMVDCKPVDMDIANSDSEDETIDCWSKDVKTSPKYSLECYDLPKDVQYEFFLQNLQEFPPPPPGVDDYEDVPPPPPYHMVYVSDSQDMDLDNEELVENHRIGEHELYSPEEKRGNPEEICVLQQMDCRAKEEDEVGDEEEEEEEALRALLLSKFQSPKNQKKTRASKKDIDGKGSLNIKEETEQSLCKTKPTEFILKEAVKRLTVHSQTEFGKEEITVDSLNPLEKLRNRLSIYKNQSQSIKTDNFKVNTDEYIFEQNEIASNSYNEAADEHTIVSNSSEVMSVIDISDITRRLQIIKDNVLKSSQNISSKDSPNYLNSEPQVDVVPSPTEYIEDIENVKEENVSQVNKTFTNNFVNTVPVSEKSNNAITKNKTVKANFDVTKNQTTFEVTITNNEAFKSEDSDGTNKLNDVTCKENNTNNMPKTVALNSERLVKITDKTTELNAENNAAINKPLTVAKSILNDTKVAATHTHSLRRTTKIIKPNKIINANLDLKPKQMLPATDSTLAPKKSKPQVNNKLTKLADNSRLITSVDQMKHMWKITPFVISLQNSCNESSEDDCGGDYNSVYKPLYDYNDNASPLSLNLESPSRTPLRSNSPIDHCVEDSIEPTDLESLNSSHLQNVVDRTPTNSADQGEKINKTPLAVRHLPAAAQSEYRRLVHRMKLLENKRKVVNIEDNKTDKQKHSSLPVADDDSKEKDKADSTNSASKTSLVKKVLLRNANNSTTPSAIAASDTQISNGSSSSTKLHRNNVLRSYESLYVKFGAGIVNNLDKSLKLVEEAKKAKLAKLKLENRLKELKAEIDSLQNKHSEEQQKISRIYPNICSTNEIITSLKQKRSKVFKAALNLGKALKGEVYRLNNDLKEIITTKSNKLATEIKIVNSLKAQDIKNAEEKIKPNASGEQQHADNKEKPIKDCKTKSKANNNVEIKPNTKTTTNNKTLCAERSKKEEEKNNLDPILKPEVGGNREFQNVVHNDSKSHDTSGATGGPDVGAKLSNACSENGSVEPLPVSSYISPLEHLRNIDSNVDPNGVVCPYDLMGNCEDVACKYVHITPKAKS